MYMRRQIRILIPRNSVVYFFDRFSAWYVLGLALSAADFIASILVLIWVFKFRRWISEIVCNDPIGFSAVMTFFFQVFYLQYKLNDIINYKGGESFSLLQYEMSLKS